MELFTIKRLRLLEMNFIIETIKVFAIAILSVMVIELIEYIV